MLDFIWIGPAEMFAKAKEQNIQNEKFVSSGIRTNAMSLHDR